MSTSLLLLASAALLMAQSSLTQTWNGLLIDDACRSANVTAKCGASTDTKAFGFEADGKYFKLDAAGTQKAQSALAARSKDAGPDVKVAVTGSVEAGLLRVTALELQ